MITENGTSCLACGGSGCPWPEHRDRCDVHHCPHCEPEPEPETGKDTSHPEWSILHPECRVAWERGLTDYPPEEHARECKDCLQWQLSEKANAWDEQREQIAKRLMEKVSD